MWLKAGRYPKDGPALLSGRDACGAGAETAVRKRIAARLRKRRDLASLLVNRKI